MYERAFPIQTTNNGLSIIDPFRPIQFPVIMFENSNYFPVCVCSPTPDSKSPPASRAQYNRVKNSICSTRATKRRMCFRHIHILRTGQCGDQRSDRPTGYFIPNWTRMTTCNKCYSCHKRTRSEGREWNERKQQQRDEQERKL